MGRSTLPPTAGANSRGPRRGRAYGALGRGRRPAGRAAGTPPAATGRAIWPPGGRGGPPLARLAPPVCFRRLFPGSGGRRPAAPLRLRLRFAPHHPLRRPVAARGAPPRFAPARWLRFAPHFRAPARAPSPPVRCPRSGLNPGLCARGPLRGSPAGARPGSGRHPGAGGSPEKAGHCHTPPLLAPPGSPPAGAARRGGGSAAPPPTASGPSPRRPSQVACRPARFAACRAGGPLRGGLTPGPRRGGGSPPGTPPGVAAGAAAPSAPRRAGRGVRATSGGGALAPPPPVQVSSAVPPPSDFLPPPAFCALRWRPPYPRALPILGGRRARSARQSICLRPFGPRKDRRQGGGQGPPACALRAPRQPGSARSAVRRGGGRLRPGSARWITSPPPVDNSPSFPPPPPQPPACLWISRGFSTFYPRSYPHDKLYQVC